jgi:hypothetical protein
MQSRSEKLRPLAPARPPVADMIATGLSRHGLPFVRLTQSSAFFSTPDRALLYSGPAMIDGIGRGDLVGQLLHLRRDAVPSSRSPS